VNPRVLFIAPSAYPLGGVQTWLDYLLPGLKASGWDPVLGLVAGRVHDTNRYVQVHPGHDVVTIDNPTGSREGRVRALCAAIRRVDPALVVAVNIGDCYPAIERLRAEGDRAPRIAMADHSLEPDFLEDARNWRHVLDGFVGTNRLTTRLAVDRAGLAPERVHYAPYGVPLKDTPRARPAQPGLPLRIGYSGRVDDRQKRAQDIPAILAALDQRGVPWQFRLAGAGPWIDSLKHQLRDPIARGAVQLLGVLDPAELDIQLYQWADVLLVTSYWETGPIVIWEAMAQDLPVLSTRYVGSGLEAGLVDGTNCLLYPVGDAQAAAHQLARLTDPALRQSIAAGGRDLVANRYTRHVSVSIWSDCLRRMLDAPPLPAVTAARETPPSGRLDRWFGAGQGETIRRLSGRAYCHDTPGGEWPHADGGVEASEEAAFWAMAEAKDAP